MCPVRHFSLAALESLSHLDTDSDSDIVPLPGMMTTQPYPNCCRWHLTDARCNYKWDDAPSICAPFAVRVASTNQYSAREGSLTDYVGTVTRLHSPIPGVVASPPPPSLDSPPPSSPSPFSSRPSSRPSSVSSASPPHASTQSPLAATQAQRWYAITKGRSICVVLGW